MKCNLPTLWTDEEWLTKNPQRISAAQVRVNEYIEANGGGSILHVGIGDSSLARKVSKLFTQIDGITNTRQEERMGNELGLSNYKIYFMNKHDPIELNKLGTYDLISDVNLKSFACCQEHWETYLKTILSKLKKGGRLVSHKDGLGGYGTEFDNSLTMYELKHLLTSEYILIEDFTGLFTIEKI